MLKIYLMTGKVLFGTMVLKIGLVLSMFCCPAFARQNAEEIEYLREIGRGLELDWKNVEQKATGRAHMLCADIVSINQPVFDATGSDLGPYALPDAVYFYRECHMLALNIEIATEIRRSLQETSKNLEGSERFFTVYSKLRWKIIYDSLQVGLVSPALDYGFLYADPVRRTGDSCMTPDSFNQLFNQEEGGPKGTLPEKEQAIFDSILALNILNVVVCRQELQSEGKSLDVLRDASGYFNHGKTPLSKNYQLYFNLLLESFAGKLEETKSLTNSIDWYSFLLTKPKAEDYFLQKSVSWTHKDRAQVILPLDRLVWTRAAQIILNETNENQIGSKHRAIAKTTLSERCAYHLSILKRHSLGWEQSVSRNTCATQERR